LEPVQALFEDLRSPDPTIRLSVLTRIEGMNWSDEQQTLFQEMLAREKDPGTKLHMRKILAGMEKRRSAVDDGSPERLVELRRLLSDESRDDLSLVMHLESVKRSAGPAALAVLRQTEWSGLPEEVLPFILNFVKKFGTQEDVPRVTELCRHPNARVMTSAVDTLEKLHPESLQPLLVPLLVSPIPGIRSRAVRLLHRWDPEEALRHFEAMLFSQELSEKKAALFQAFFFPFADIARHLLRFLSIESEAGMLLRVGFIFRANPAPEVLLPLIDIMEVCREQKRKLIGDILTGVIKSLSQAGLIAKTPEEILADVKTDYRGRKAGQLIERCQMALVSGTEESRKTALTKLCELARAGFAEAEEALTLHLPVETSTELQQIIATYFGGSEDSPEIAESPSPASSPEQDLRALSPGQRARFFDALDEGGFAQAHTQLSEWLSQSSGDDKIACLALFARFGSSADAGLLLPVLDDSDPALVTGAIDALLTAAPETLFPRLPGLLLNESDLVRAVAVKAISRFDKTRALDLFGQMLQSIQAAHRRLAVSNLSQLDFPSIRQLLLDSLEKETDGENLQQLRAILKSNIDEPLFTDLMKIRRIADGEKRGVMDCLVLETARILIRDKKVKYPDPAALQAAVEEKLDREKERTATSKPSYSLDSIKKMRSGPETPARPRTADPIRLLADDLRSPDLSMRFSVLSRLETIEWTSDRVEAFKKLVDRERDPGTKFHMKKILAHVSGERKSGPVNVLTEIAENLQKTHRDDLSLALLLESLPRKDALKAVDVLRKAHWEGFSPEILPFVLQFFKKFGRPEDAPTIEPFCRHSDPRILGAAVETLEKLAPESLREQIVPLLVSPNQGIRSRAVRLLYRWDPREALKHFEEMLFAEDAAERQAALFHAFFFPFADIEPHLLKLLAIESSTDILEKAGFIFRANPTPEEPRRLIEVMEESRGEKRQVIWELISGVILSLSQAGLMEESPEKALEDLQTWYRERKTRNFIARCRIALESQQIDMRRTAVDRLIDLAHMDCGPALDCLREFHGRETDAQLKARMAGALGQAEIPAKTEVKDSSEPEAQDLLAASPETRQQFLGKLSAADLNRYRPRLREILSKSDRGEKVLWIQALGRVGTKNDAELLRSFISDPDSGILSAVIETLRRLDPDVLSPYLPKLIQNPSDEVKAEAIRVFALFDKKQAVALIEKMLFSLQTRQRQLAVFCAGQIDFPSVHELLLRALGQEQDNDNWKQIAAIIQANLDEKVYEGLLNLLRHAGRERHDQLEALEQEAARTLIAEKKTSFLTPVELKKALEKRLKEAEESGTETKAPSYALANIKKMREKKGAHTPAPSGVDPALVRFAMVAFSLGMVITALVWFLFLAPSSRRPVSPATTTKQTPGTKPPKAFSTDPVDLVGEVSAIPDPLSVQVKSAQHAKEFIIRFKSKPHKPYRVGQPFKAQVKPLKEDGNTILAEILMSF
jgi:HEAT repeat protein